MTTAAQAAENIPFWKRTVYQALRRLMLGPAPEQAAAISPESQTSNQEPIGQTSGQAEVSRSPTYTRPADHPNAVRPTGHGRHLGAITGSTDDSLKDCLQQVVSRTSILMGTAQVTNPDRLIHPFMQPDGKQTVRVLSKAIAKQLALDEFPEVVLGVGQYGGILAYLVVEALVEMGHPVEFLGLEPNTQAASAEGYHFDCPEVELRRTIGGKRIALVMPIVTNAHLADIGAIRTLVAEERCAATFADVGTIIQYGSHDAIHPLEVRPLVRIGINV